MERKVTYLILSGLFFFISSCTSEKKDKVEYWVNSFCDCANMPNIETQIGCNDTWRSEMKKDLNESEQKRCWDAISKINNGDCSKK